ncbi:hypothetical protein [Oleiharenicola sp. Vm1]|uniref:hypothetical protein n=1 Tax=Oleiharenicola sp. Vm1 TaxID=3398393 RepID=UPI0039F5E0D7
MKTPFPAVLIETHAEPYWSVMARRCVVLELFPATQTARVGVGSAIKAPGALLEIVVPWSRLASTRERAVELICGAAGKVIIETLSPAPDEKSAVNQTLAGAGA